MTTFRRENFFFKQFDNLNLRWKSLSFFEITHTLVKPSLSCQLGCALWGLLKKLRTIQILTYVLIHICDVSFLYILVRTFVFYGFFIKFQRLELLWCKLKSFGQTLLRYLLLLYNNLIFILFQWYAFDHSFTISLFIVQPSIGFILAGELWNWLLKKWHFEGGSITVVIHIFYLNTFAVGFTVLFKQLFVLLPHVLRVFLVLVIHQVA
jgi:hypothetical protein